MDNLLYNAIAPWQGYFHWVGNIREGQTPRGGNYAFADFTIKYRNHRMQENYITFSVADQDKVDLLKSLKPGTPVRVVWTPETSYDANRDRYYPKLQAWSVTVIHDQEAQPQPQNAAPAYGGQQSRALSSSGQDESDLPF